MTPYYLKSDNMSLLNTNVVDFISIDTTGNVVLTVADECGWDERNEHLLALQNKINRYLDFIESGDIYQQYAHVEGRKIIVRLAFKYEPNETAIQFLRSIDEILKVAELRFQYKVSHPGE